MKTLGVLGGMGPAATVAFLARVQALTPAEGDADHIRVLADINPQVPDRNREPGAAERVLGEMARALVAAGAQVLAMPCNTAHGQAAEIRRAGAPFIDMIEATADVAAATGAKRVGVLATPGGEALYAAALAARGVEIVRLAGADREAFMACVYAVKRGDVGSGAARRDAASGGGAGCGGGGRADRRLHRGAAAAGRGRRAGPADGLRRGAGAGVRGGVPVATPR